MSIWTRVLFGSTTVVALVAISPPSCVRPTEERAERDLEIGRTTSAGLDIRVVGGLAAVRHVEPGELRLWASAPAIEIVVEPNASDAQRGFELDVENLMPNADLRVIEAGGPGTRVSVVEPIIGTHGRWQVELEPGARARFSLAPPDSDDRVPFRFAVLSDVQEAIVHVQDVFQKINGVDGVRFLLGAGDLTQRGQASELERYQFELEKLAVPYYTTLGNHELGVDPPRYQDYFGRASFHFSFKHVHFSEIDSASATIDPIVYDWLDGWLDDARAEVHIVAMHIPPLDPIGVRNGAFGSRNEAAKLLVKLANGKVDLTLYGHIHSYYHFDNAGIDAYISGGGGSIPERFDGIGRHFLVVDVGADSGVEKVSVVRVD